MTKAEIIKAARESLRVDSLRPGRDRFAEMVTQGVIDARGKVLVKGPIVTPPADAEIGKDDQEES